MNNSAWISAREKVGLHHVRAHDLKHTFGRRLRSAGVSEEDRQDLLGHKSRRITTHYSMAELQNVIAATNKACDRNIHGIALTLLKRKSIVNSVELSNSRKRASGNSSSPNWTLVTA